MSVACSSFAFAFSGPPQHKSTAEELDGHGPVGGEEEEENKVSFFPSLLSLLEKKKADLSLGRSASTVTGYHAEVQEKGFSSFADDDTAAGGTFVLSDGAASMSTDGATLSAALYQEGPGAAPSVLLPDRLCCDEELLIFGEAPEPGEDEARSSVGSVGINNRADGASVVVERMLHGKEAPRRGGAPVPRHESMVASLAALTSKEKVRKRERKQRRTTK